MVRLRSRLILLMILIALGAASHRALSVGAAELPTIEVGLPDDGLFGLGGHYLVDKGLDRKNGFIMKARWAGVPEIERILAIGAIPVGLSTSESALRANLRDINIRLIQPFMTPHNSVVVRKDAPYKSIMDLKGKPFAVPPEVTSAYNNFDYIMKKQGMDIEKFFQLKKLGAAGISTTLERGDVEAGYSWEAHASKLLARGRYRIMMVPRDEMNRLLNTKVKILGWVGALNLGLQRTATSFLESAKPGRKPSREYRKTRRISVSTLRSSLAWRSLRSWRLAGRAPGSFCCLPTFLGPTKPTWKSS